MEQELRERIDPSLTAENLSVLCSRALGKQVRASSVEVLHGGCWNRVVAVGFHGDAPELVLKVSAKAEAPEIVREHDVLRYFRENTSLPVPRPYLVDSSATLIPGTLLVMERLRGRVLHAAYGTLSPEQRLAISRQIASHVTELHGIRAAGFGGVELRPEERHASWPEFWLPRFRKVLEESRREALLDPSFLDRVERASGRFPSLLDVGARGTLTHYDIWSGNVMVEVSRASARVSGYVDPPGIFADYARELSFMEMFGLADETLLTEYARAHPIDVGFQVRKCIYNLKMHMKHVSMYPDEPYYRQGAEACLAFIEQCAG